MSPNPNQPMSDLESDLRRLHELTAQDLQQAQDRPASIQEEKTLAGFRQQLAGAQTTKPKARTWGLVAAAAAALMLIPYVLDKQPTDPELDNPVLGVADDASSPIQVELDGVGGALFTVPEPPPFESSYQFLVQDAAGQVLCQAEGIFDSKWRYDEQQCGPLPAQYHIVVRTWQESAFGQEQLIETWERSFSD